MARNPLASTAVLERATVNTDLVMSVIREIMGELPPSGCRLNFRNRSKIVLAIASGDLSKPEATARYRVSESVLDDWLDTVTRHGLAALRNDKPSFFL